MRSARNVFIGNLALSDLCLCVVTMPLTLVSENYLSCQADRSSRDLDVAVRCVLMT